MWWKNTHKIYHESFITEHNLEQNLVECNLRDKNDKTITQKKISELSIQTEDVNDINTELTDTVEITRNRTNMTEKLDFWNRWKSWDNHGRCSGKKRLM